MPSSAARARTEWNPEEGADLFEIPSILAPTDFSPHSAVAVKYACGLAERLGSTLHLLHVLPDVIPVGPEPMLAPVPPPEYYREAEAHARSTLETLIDPSWGSVPRRELAVRWGDPIDAIISHAASHTIGLIVIATHGRTGLTHILLGSVAERIVREAPCPVLTIRDRKS